MHRRAQTAIEFLVTYGWAFLVILIMLSALSYFGVFNPDSLLPQRCTFTVGIACIEAGIVNTNFVATLNNNIGDLVIGPQSTRVLNVDGSTNVACSNTTLVFFSYTGTNQSDTTGLIAPLSATGVTGTTWNASTQMYVRLLKSGCLATLKGRTRIIFTMQATALGKSYPQTISGEILTQI